MSVGSSFLPWPLQRLVLRALLGWKLHPTSRIGMSLILADRVVLEEGARIGHLQPISPIGLLHLERFAVLGHGNIVGGGQRSPNYREEPDRVSALILEEHAAVTRHHILDCSNTIVIGRFTTFAGYRSQILTHSPDFSRSHQTTRPVRIGSYCFVGTGSIILFGSELPDFCFLGAGSVLSGKPEGNPPDILR